MASTLGRSLLAALALTLCHAAALAAVNPIPGIGIVVKKNPGGGARVEAVTDARGRFTLRISEPGDYTISTECPRAHTPRPCPPRTLSVRGEGVALRAGRDGSYDFTVTRNCPAVLAGLVMTVNGGPVAGDMDGDGRAARPRAEPQREAEAVVSRRVDMLTGGASSRNEAATGEPCEARPAR